MHGQDTYYRGRCGGGHMESFLLLLFSCEKGIRSIREEFLDSYEKRRKYKLYQSVDISLGQHCLGVYKDVLGYKAINKFNTIHFYMYSLPRFLPTTFFFFLTLGIPLLNYCSLTICSSLCTTTFYTHTFQPDVLSLLVF